MAIGKLIEDERREKKSMSKDNISEAKTRIKIIDPLLTVAGWNLNDLTKVRIEVPVDGYDAEPWKGVTDYCLYDARNNVLAVVEKILTPLKKWLQ